MASRKVTRENIRQMMKYNMKIFFKNPHNFDCPPPNYDRPDDLGWKMLAKAIVATDGGLEKYISYAKRAKLKQEEWNNLPFIKPFPPKKSKYK